MYRWSESIKKGLERQIKEKKNEIGKRSKRLKKTSNKFTK
jgi:hypothetical protein